jgi:hypothetical protein
VAFEKSDLCQGIGFSISRVAKSLLVIVAFFGSPIFLQCCRFADGRLSLRSGEKLFQGARMFQCSFERKTE